MAERGTIIEGKYEVLKLIGKGGMSKVYLAMDKNLNKQWAIKEIERKAYDNIGSCLCCAYRLCGRGICEKAQGARRRAACCGRGIDCRADVYVDQLADVT